MKRSTTKTNWTLAAAAAALLAVPAHGTAQTPAAPQTQPPAATQPAPPAGTAQPNTAAAREHLAKAKTALDDIAVASLNARAKTQVAELKRRLNALERAVAANDSASATGTAARSPQATASARGAANWGTEVAAMDKTLAALLGDAAAPAATGTSGATAKNKAAAAITLDDATRTKLTDVRTHITAFATVMAGGSVAPSPDPAAAPAEPTSAAAAPATTEAPAAAAAPAAQPDQEAARRYLTEARNTLSALTQLPAASQLTGDARTQVSQLISNFNELITTQSEWRASYAKVSANLSALLGPDTGTPDPSTASGTAGAVGTSGSATATLDATVRAKLVELRTNLSQFEKAAGGGAAMASAPAASAAAEPASTPATPPTATPSSSAAPSATPATRTHAAPAADTAPAMQPAANTEVAQHIAAIEALIKSENEGGGLTLTKAQVEQLRMHWAALLKSVK